MFDLSKKTTLRIKTALHGFVTVVSSASIIVSSVSASYAQQIIVDPSAPGTSFLQTSNGTPQVNIATPQGGVSLNQFETFNVDQNGLVLNNATTGGVSVIGQNVTANPNLMVSGPADTIVNEVTSAAPSTLTGTTEVFGQSAAVVIANPNGISCNGCAFLNSTSSTLTTGKPIISGPDVDLLVTQGTVTIGPDGFAAGQQAGVFGRHVIVDGPISTDRQWWQDSLVVSGGAQRVNGLDFDMLRQSPIVAAPSTVSKTSPFAVDISENGKLTGGGTAIRGQEVGQGVNIYGDVDVHSIGATSRGDLFYKNINSDYWVYISGRDVRQYGDLTATRDVTIRGDSFTLYDGRKILTGVLGDGSYVDGNGHLHGQVTVVADDFVVIAGEVSGEEIHINVANGSLTNTGFLMADGDLTIVASENVSQQREIAQEYDIYFDPALQQYLQAYYAQLIAGGPEADIAAEMIERAGQHEIIAEYIDRGATTTGTNVTITATNGDVSNTGGAIAATNDARLAAGADIINTYLALRTKLGSEDGCSAENCGYRTDFHAGEILAGNDLDLVAGRDIRNEASDIAAANNITLDAGRDVVNALRTSNFEASEVVAVQITGPLGYSSANCGKDCVTSTVLVTGEYTANDLHFNEENILAPARIASLYGNVAINADRDFISAGSEVTSGSDLSIAATGQAILSSYTDVEENFVQQTRRATQRSCTTGKDGGSCTTSVVAPTTTIDDRVMVTAASKLVGQTINITSGDNLTIIGARILASKDLDLKSTAGSVLIDSTDLPNTYALGHSGPTDLVELTDDLVAQIFGPESGEAAQTVVENTDNYIAFLQDNELLTAVEALRRAESGADIKDAAREVGVQSYISLIDSTRLNSLRVETQAAIDAIHAGAGADLDAHNATLSGYNQDILADLAELEDRLGLTDSERTAEINTALESVTAQYQANTSAAETTYTQALAASQAQYGHLLTKQEQRTRQVGSGKGSYTQTYYVTVPNTYYVNLKNSADAQALADRTAALSTADTQRQINEALVQASYSDAGISAEMEELASAFAAQLNTYAEEKVGLLANYNTQVSNAMRQAELVLQQEVIEDGLRNEAVAEGTVVEGEKSLAVALTSDAFPELALVQDLVTNADGVVENHRDGDEQRVHLVTRTRDIGEFQDIQTTRQETRYTYRCSGSGKQESCGNVATTVTVPVTETQWVITGTEDFLAQETYFDGVASQTALLSPDKDEQDAFLAATAWRFASHNAQEVQSPRNRLLSQSDLTISAKSGAHLGQGSFDAFGRLNVSSIGGVIAKSAELSGSQIDITAGGDLKGYGLTLEATDDISLYAVGAVNIAGLGRTYTNETGFENIIGTLAAEAWTDQRAGGTGAGARIMVSQELSKITSGSDLTITALGDLTLGGVTADIAGNVTLTTNTNLALNAPRSVIEYHVGDDRNGTDLWDIRSHVTDITTGGSFSAMAGDTALLEGTKINAGGALDLSATNDVTVSAAQNIYEYSHRTYSSSLLSKRSSRHSITRLLHAGADLTSDGTLDIESQEGNLTTAGSRFESQTGDINLSATQGDVLAGVFTDIDRENSEYHKSSFFGLISSSGTSLVDHRNATGTSALADLDLTIVSGGDTELVGAQLSAGRDLNLNVGGDLRVLAAIDSTRKEFFESNMGVVLATTVTERSHKETAVLTSLNAKGELNISVGGKTYLTLYGYEGEDGQTAAELYPEELASLANLILLDEELLDEYFYEETKSLSPAFVAILSIALTAGFGSMLAAQFPALTTGGAAAAGSTATAADLTLAGKAVASFAASSTIGLANGAVSGDIDLKEILKNAALSAGTQFLTASINLRIAGDTAGADALAEAGEAATEAAGTFGNQTYTLLGGSWGEGFSRGLFVESGKLTAASVLEGAFDATISSGLSSAISGSDFREGLTTSLVRSVVALGLADTQNQIGGIGLEEGSVSHALLHGLAGCAAAEASGADCRAGAVAGIAQSIYAGTLSGNLTSEERLQALQNSELIGAITGFVFSGGNADNVSLSASIAQSGLANNYLSHDQWAELIKEIDACSGDADCIESNLLEASVLSVSQDIQLNNCIASGNQGCVSRILTDLRELDANYAFTVTELVDVLDDAGIDVRDSGLINGLFGLDANGLYSGRIVSFNPGNYDGALLEDYQDYAAANCSVGSDCLRSFSLYRWQQWEEGTNNLLVAGLAPVVLGAAVLAGPEILAAISACAGNPACVSQLSVISGEAALGLSGATAGQTFYAAGSLVAVTGGRLIMKHGDEVIAVFDDLGNVFRPVSQNVDDAGRFLVKGPDGVIGYLDDIDVFATINRTGLDEISDVTGHSLIAHENWGGHTITRHVGKSDADLSARLANDPNIDSASSFPTVDTASRAVANTVLNNQSTVTNWLSGGVPKIVISSTSNINIGRVMQRGSTNPIPTNRVTVVLVRDSLSAKGYTVLTSYPDL